MAKPKTTRAPRKPAAAKSAAAPATAPVADAGAVVTGDGTGTALPPITDTNEQEFQSANGAEAKPEDAAASSGGDEAKASDGPAADAADPGGTSGAPTAPGEESRGPASGASADRKDASGVEKQPEDSVQPPVVGLNDSAAAISAAGARGDFAAVDAGTVAILLDDRLDEFEEPGVEVVGPKQGRRRAGRQFGRDPVTIPLGELTAEDMQAIAADPKLSWSIVELADVG